MTTPERLRRRQRIETALLVLIVVLTTSTAVFFIREDNKQQDCIARLFDDLGETLKARGDLAQQESDATREVIEAAANDPTGVKVRVALNDYLQAQTRIKQQRKENPVPPFPTGRCENG